MREKGSGVDSDGTESNVTAGPPTARRGRKRDNSRDADILSAALEVLTEVGYDGMTMDMVAVRAKAGKATVYRRWSSKEDMVLDAVARTRPGAVSLDELPDTGNLRSDLLALFEPQPRKEAEARMKVMAALAAMTATHPGFEVAVDDTMVESWAQAYRVLMRRARERGQIADSADIEIVAQVIPSVAAYRTLIQRKPFENDFLTSWIDGVVLPALTYRPPQAHPSRPHGS